MDEDGAEMLVSEQPELERQRERSQHSQAHPGSPAAGGAQCTKVSSQRQEHQERLENLVSQKRSQKKPEDRPSQESATESESEDDSEESLTESESEQDVPIQPPCSKTGPPLLESITEVQKPESEKVMAIQSPQPSSEKKRVSPIFTYTSSFNVFVSALQIPSLKTTTISSRNQDSPRNSSPPNLRLLPALPVSMLVRHVVHKEGRCIIATMLRVLDTWFLVT